MQEKKDTTLTLLQTKRLVLRQLFNNDKEQIFSLRSDPGVNQFIDRATYSDPEEATAFIIKINEGIKNNEWYYWAITLKNSDLLIGTICLWNINWKESVAEIGFEMLPQHQGQGLMREAIECVMQFTFEELKLNVLQGFTHKFNTRSISLMEKIGFTKVSQELTKNSETNMIVYLLRKNDNNQ